MNTISFRHQNKAISRNAPSVWNEVTAKQLLQWMAVLYAKVSDEVKLAMAVPVFYGLSVKIYAALKPHQRVQIAPTLRSLLSENRLSKWVMPSFRLWFTRYYGPADKLVNLTAHEFFNVCEPLFWAFKKTQDVDALTALCAALYRPKRRGAVDNDVREPFNEAGYARRIKKFKRLSLNGRLAIAFNYEGCRNFIATAHPKAFEPKQGSSKKRGDVTLALAGGPLGNHAETKTTNLYTFLLHLVNLIDQEEELKNERNRK